MTENPTIAFIGGSGVKDSPFLEEAKWDFVKTNVARGTGNDGTVWYQRAGNVVFIPRHGRHDGEYKLRRSPNNTQYAANIVAAYALGARVVVATSAVGSLNSGIKPESVVVPHDYIDESGRDDNLFGNGIVVHTSPRPAFSEGLRGILLGCANEIPDFEVHDGGIYVTIPGDRFGTAAEGKKRAGYADLVGMTCNPEAPLAMQAGMHYAMAAFPVDMDLDANHEGGTMEIMGRMSEPHIIPAYMAAVAKKTTEFARDAPPLEQLRGNIIPVDLAQVSNLKLRKIAEHLHQTYCR